MLKSGRSGIIDFSYGTEFKNDFLIEVVSSNGSVSMTPTGAAVAEKTASGERKEETKTFPFNTGVSLELEAFGKAIESKTRDPRQTAEEALLDLKIVEALLKSGDQGGVALRV